MLRAGSLASTDLINGAESIVVGIITSMDFVDKRRAGDCLVLVRVRVAIEDVLRGSFPQNELEYYYYGPWCGTSGPVETPQIGSRSVFFLRKEQGSWRTLADYWRNRLPVRSGRHPKSSVAGKSVNEAIAEILLTPGEGYTDEGYVKEASYEARNIVGADQTERLLRPILGNWNEWLRISACVALQQYSRGSDCAKPILADYLDKFERRNFSRASVELVADLFDLARAAAPADRDRAERLLPIAKAVLAPAPVPAPPLPAGLK